MIARNTPRTRLEKGDLHRGYGGMDRGADGPRGFELIDGRELEGPVTPDIPGMTGEGEGRYLYQLAKLQPTAGRIVEIGSWLGRSAYYLGKGANTHVDCYDDFTWREAFTNKIAGNVVTDRHIDLNPGENFQHIFDENVQHLGIRSHRQKISDISIDSGEITLVHLDAPKRTRELVQVFRELRAKMKPGHTIIVAQDYKHQMSHDVPLFFELLRDYLKPLHSVRNSPTVSFRLTHEIPECFLDVSKLDGRNMNVSQLREIWVSLCARLPDEDQIRVSQGLAFLLSDRKHYWASLLSTKDCPVDRNFLRRLYRSKAHVRLYFPILVGSMLYGVRKS